MTREEAIKRAMKLLKLSESSNVHEAALAAQRAQELLNRFGITQEIVDAEKGGPREKVEEIEQQEVERGGAVMPQWKAYLANTLAKANQCRTHTMNSNVHRNGAFERSASIVIVGRASDAATVRYMYQAMCHEVEKLTKRETAAHIASSFLTAAALAGRSRTWANNFRLGVVDAIRVKLEDAARRTREEMRQEVSSNSTALVKVDTAIARIEAKDNAVVEWRKQNLKLHTTKSTATYDPNARQRGQIAGASLNVGGAARGSLGSSAKRVQA